MLPDAPEFPRDEIIHINIQAVMHPAVKRAREGALLQITVLSQLPN